MKYIDVEKSAAFTGHRDCLYALTLAENGQQFFTSGADGMVAQWDADKPDEGKLVAKVPNTVYSLVHLPEQNALLFGQNYEGIHRIDLESMQETHSVKLGNTTFFDVKVYKDLVLVATGAGEVIALHLPDLSVIKKLSHSRENARCIAINSERMEFAVGYSDHKIRLFSLADFRLLATLQGHDNSVFCLAYSNDYQHLLSGGRDAHLKIWDARNGYELSEDIVAHMYTLNHIAFRADGRYFATCSKDKSIKIWDAKQFKLLKVIDKARHAGHGTSVNKLAWLSDNQLISISDDHSASLWQLQFNI